MPAFSVFWWLVGFSVSLWPSQSACALANLPEEPAVTPTLQLYANVTIGGSTNDIEQQKETWVHREIDVKEEELEELTDELPGHNTKEQAPSHLQMTTKTEAYSNPQGYTVVSSYYGFESVTE